MLKRDWTTCLEYDHRFRFHNRHTRGDLYGHLMSTRIVDSVMNTDIHVRFLDYEESGYGLNLDLLAIFVLSACLIS